MIKKLEETGEDDDGKWACPSCTKSYTRKKRCVAHVKDVHFGRQHPCLQCREIFASSLTLHRHVCHVHTKRAFRYIKALPGLEAVLVYENEQITAREFEEADRDNMFDHWLCEYKPNPLTGEPAPHKFASGFYGLRDERSLRASVVYIKNKAQHNTPTEKRGKVGCESIRKVFHLNFVLDLDTVRSSGIYLIGELTAVKLKPPVRDAVYATYSRNDWDSLNLFNDASKAHFHATLMSARKDEEEQLQMWKKWALENVGVLVKEVLNHPLCMNGV